MRKEIYWKILLNTKEESKAIKMRDSISKLLVNAESISLELYWKQKSHYHLKLKQRILSDTKEGTLYEVMTKISKISNSWNISFDSDDFDLSGISESSFKQDYVTWASFMIQDENTTILDIC